MNRRTIPAVGARVLLALALLATIGSASSAAPPAKPPAEGASQKYTDWPITVTGRALDPAGKPIEGATVFLVSTNASPDKKLAETKTDGRGQYSFRDIAVPIRVPQKPTGDYQEGTFQIFGKAPGRGFAWHGMKSLYVDPLFIGPDGKKTVMEPENGYFPGEKIEIDLTFFPPKQISGRFVDDGGRPIAGVKLRVQSCDFADPGGRVASEAFRQLNANRQATALMPDQLSAKTDADGRFSFQSMPPDVVCLISANHSDYGQQLFHAANSATPPRERRGVKVLPLPIAITMPKTRAVTATVRFADNKRPAVGALLTAFVQLGVGTSARGYCDKNGQVTLKLPPGEYTLSAIPPSDTDYVNTISQLVVNATETPQSKDVTLDLGCVVFFKALDIETGKGIENVDFWFIDDAYPWREPGKREAGKRWFIQSNTSMNDFPKSDLNGTVRAVVYPGTRLYGVGMNPLPDGYTAQDRDKITGQKIECPAGKTVIVVFLLQK